MRRDFDICLYLWIYSHELDVQNGWEENTHTHTHSMSMDQGQSMDQREVANPARDQLNK